MTRFADYLHNKNIQNKLAEPVFRPQSLDAYLELKHTVEIMTQQVQDLEQQKKGREEARRRKPHVKSTMGRRGKKTIVVVFSLRVYLV